LCGSLAVSMHAPKQNDIPVPHESTLPQWPDTHAVPVPQTTPHAPQLFASACKSAQVDPQTNCPTGHTLERHIPLSQTSPVVQRIPHEPQCIASLCRSTQSVPHRVAPLEQAARHCPPIHVSVSAHACPHAPQFAGSCDGSTHAPLHSIRTPAHPVDTQRAALHCSPVAHA
jgi:hypothetical protein